MQKVFPVDYSVAVRPYDLFHTLRFIEGVGKALHIPPVKLRHYSKSLIGIIV